MNSCCVFVCANPTGPELAGTFTVSADSAGWFQYAEDFLVRSDAFTLDPVLLPLMKGQHKLAQRPYATYGALSDAGPETWGEHLTTNICLQMKAPLPQTLVDRLLLTNYGAGCLQFSAGPDQLPTVPTVPLAASGIDERHLDIIEQLAGRVDTQFGEEALRLLGPGASLGGSRPKTVVMHNDAEHIAKFSRADDPFDVPLAEYATMRLALLAGIDVPDLELKRVGDRSVLLVSRFDRTAGGGRLHYISARSLINTEMFNLDGRAYRGQYSYGGIAECAPLLRAQPQQTGHEVFRRMVFNILVGNVGDHLGNHGFIRISQNEYQLSPAFDMVPHLDAPLFSQAIGVGEAGAESTLANAMSQLGRFYLIPKLANQIIEQVRAVISTWREEFKRAGMTPADIATLAPCFAAADAREKIYMPPPPPPPPPPGA